MTEGGQELFVGSDEEGVQICGFVVRIEGERKRVHGVFVRVVESGGRGCGIDCDGCCS